MRAHIFLNLIFIVIREKDEIYILSSDSVKNLLTCLKPIKKPINLLKVVLSSSQLFVTSLEFLHKLLENVFKEQKSISLLRDFTVNILNYNEHNALNGISRVLAFTKKTHLK